MIINLYSGIFGVVAVLIFLVFLTSKINEEEDTGIIIRNIEEEVEEEEEEEDGDEYYNNDDEEWFLIKILFSPLKYNNTYWTIIILHIYKKPL